MYEEIDTANKYDNSIQDGTYDFIVESVTKKVKNSVNMYILKLTFKGESGERETGEQILFPSGMGPLLEVLGCKKTSGDKYGWDPDMMQGKAFMATVKTEPDKKDATKMRQNMKDFKPSAETSDIPF